MNLNILFEDKNIIVCNKPAGVSSQEERSFCPDMVSLIRNHIADGLVKQGKKIESIPYVGVIHRLDKPVNGIIVYAKNKNCAGILSKDMQSENSSFIKHYKAKLLGHLEGDTTDYVQKTDYLLHDVKTNTSSVVSKNTPNSKKAILKYKIISYESIDNSNYTNVDIVLLTGRHHQIRVQFSNMGFPILGDVRYNTSSNTNLCLCAYSLSFRHPITKKILSFTIA